jgi:hypothetical protein
MADQGTTRRAAPIDMTITRTNMRTGRSTTVDLESRIISKSEFGLAPGPGGDNSTFRNNDD